ncbi:MAG: hypothetical protein ACRD16_17720 [Thermoanaerobaculia bacterium]
MSCDFFEKHFIAAGEPAAFEDHRRACEECRALSAGFTRLSATFSSTGLPRVPASAREAWKRIPSLSIDCERADEFSARDEGDPLSQEDRRRLDFHLSRCEACRETAAVLGVGAELRPPVPGEGWTFRPPAPVLSLSEARRERASRRSGWSDPRLYAAAACFLAGFCAFFANSLPSSPAAGGSRSVTGEIRDTVRVRWAEAADRVQIWQEGISRHWVATRETLTGYTRAAGAIALSAAGRATEGFLRNETKTEKGNKS